jgi:hypothetical protein
VINLDKIDQIIRELPLLVIGGTAGVFGSMFGTGLFYLLGALISMAWSDFFPVFFPYLFIFSGFFGGILGFVVGWVIAPNKKGK